MAGDGHFLYAVNSFEGTIKGFAVSDNGSLTMITAVGGLPINPFAPLSVLVNVGYQVHNSL